MRAYLPLLLSTDRRQRIRLAQSWLAGMLVLSIVGVLHIGAAMGYVRAGPLWWWTAAALAGVVLVLATIRSGLNRRLRDPAMTMPQMFYGVLCAAWAYTFTGDARVIACLVLAIVLMFGAFGLSVRQILGLGGFALALFATVMYSMAGRDPLHYPPRLEVCYFAALCAMVVGLTLLTVRLQLMRERLRRQKSELEAALAHIQRLATHDELTGLGKRRRKQELLENERLRSRRSGTSWCLALIDLDHFKRVNDEHGHAIGDAALRALSHHAQALVRKTDVLARWGGEEFVLLLPDTGLPLGAVSLDRLRAHFHAAPLHVHGIELSLSFSAGITQHQGGESVTQTLERADRLCYEAKAKGRNRVEAFAG
jgi:diguanylate cyclase (GGDEF)-like protein